MNLSPEVDEWVAVYEQENGREPDDLVLQIVEHIVKVGKKLTERGYKDAQEGKKPYPANMFPALVAKAFWMDVEKDYETVQAVADLWQSDYMEGYNTRKECCGA